MLIFTALEKTYGRECAFDIATKSDDHVLKLVAIAAADDQAAQTLLHDLATLRQKREGTPQHNAGRWQHRVNRALDWLRHAHGSHALDRGATLAQVQATLGHANVATTRGYLHARPDSSSGLYLDEGIFR